MSSVVCLSGTSTEIQQNIQLYFQHESKGTKMKHHALLIEMSYIVSGEEYPTFLQWKNYYYYFLITKEGYSKVI